MKSLILAAGVSAALVFAVVAGQTQAPQPPAPTTSADPYANNAAPGTT